MVRCNDCGWENEAGATFCSNDECGHFLGWQAGAETSQTAPLAAPTRAPAVEPKLPSPSAPIVPLPPPSSAPSIPPRMVKKAEVEPPRVARPTAQYQMTRQRQEPVSVTRIDTRASAPTSAGTSSSDGKHGLYVVVDQRDLTVQPGMEIAFSVRVRNTGTHIERAVIEVPDLPPEWISIDPPGLNLDVGTEDVVLVRLRPPLAASTRTGRIPFVVAVWSATNLHVRCEEPLSVTVGAFEAVTLTAEPTNVAGRGKASFSIRVSNQGNYQVDGTLHAEVADATARVRCEPRQITVRPGESAVAALAVLPRKRLITGAPTVHTVTIRLDSKATTGVAMVMYRQIPRLSKMAAKVVSVLMIVALLVAAMAVKTAISNRPRAVPDVAGQAVDAAQELLKKKGFEPDVQKQADENVAQDSVIKQDPPAGTKRSNHSKVTIFVSTGPTKFEVANVQGVAKADAKATLEAQGLRVIILTSASTAVPKGAVISQVPPPPTKVAKGDSVTLTISTG